MDGPLTEGSLARLCLANDAVTGNLQGMSDDALMNRFELAQVATRAAGKLTLQYFRKSVEVQRKSDSTPVTDADRNAELYLREQIGAAFPADGIVGEEFPEVRGSSGYRWILDPIDGTKTFVCGVPLFGTLVGVEYEGRSVAGVIDMPALNECVYAAKGHGAWYQTGGDAPTAARVSNCARLEDGLVVTSQIDTFRERGAWDAYRQLETGAWVTRTWGDCYGYLLVATGRAAVMIDPIMSIWDAAALQPILEEAGGVFTDWQGQATIHGGEGIGTNQQILEEVLKITRPFAAKSS